ncbi:MAG: 50S ribosomal protein L24 [Parcubacteria group bacterium GW2011_GWA2_47_8b]|uniref:Large ribosomal subunit protein uL24 n=3 Tax=Parcubacteria group TaxID=1794811 RepID=A0A0G1T4L4_9BACT|nr:MAG: 50S ribosomal protein L24 [Candidatus Giovannonibacteria bacterium GW2011_GWB1_47_6b]KKU85311.1 MAG: 50S ribosomal protein L24 [Parcubacteria group bacterium GW2011_GWA2_47_8b]KKU93274.1 MAG: 50S ribosomal protein L24 [Parcubacteria group bacterium GW2011_GWA1_48_11b]OGY65047.1 MAG: 50S ribosomal protein L24 [Candidatus Harrisonbacteria bacterium RIFCSPHIGHO2_12_FULL_48_16]OGY68589.1 MAG: 50S ribosomal protein L24 [Candidatus Harrisonbacteria bacterium RIFOXYA1_FULL_48_8]
MKIHKGDTVQIISGKDNGKTGKVLGVNVRENTVLIEGQNLFKKHSRPKKQGEKGQIITLPRPLYISKVMLFCPNCKKATRIAYKVNEQSKTKSRQCKKCNTEI